MACGASPGWHKAGCDFAMFCCCDAAVQALSRFLQGIPIDDLTYKGEVAAVGICAALTWVD